MSLINLLKPTSSNGGKLDIDVRNITCDSISGGGGSFLVDSTDPILGNNFIMIANGTLGPRELKQSTLTITSNNLKIPTGNYLEASEIRGPSDGHLTLQSAFNKDVNIDALGAGKVLINTVQSQSMIIGVNTGVGLGDGIYVAKNGDLTNPCLVFGIHEVSSEQHPSIFATTPGVAVRPLRLGISVPQSVVINNTSSPDSSFVHSLEVEGSINVRTGGSYYMGGTLTIDNNRNGRFANVICSGQVPRTICGFVNLSVAFPSQLQGLYISLPTGVSYINNFRAVINFAGGNGSGAVELRDLNGILLLTLLAGGNGNAQLLDSGAVNVGIGGFCELRVLPSSATTGAFTLVSYSIAVNG